MASTKYASLKSVDDDWVDAGKIYMMDADDELQRGSVWNTMKQAFIGPEDAPATSEVTKNARAATRGTFSRLSTLLRIGFRHRYCSYATLILLLTFVANVLGALGTAIIPLVISQIACLVTCTCEGNEQVLKRTELGGMLAFCVILIFVLVFISSLSILGSLHLGVITRVNILDRLQGLYFSRGMYYKIANLDDRVDNPDQRLTTDCYNLTAAVFGGISPKVDSLIFGGGGVVALTLNSLLMTTVVANSAGALGVGVCYAWFFLAMIIQYGLVRKLSVIIFRQEETEGTFRFAHTRIRTNAESIAFYEGAKKEAESTRGRLAVAADNQRRLANWSFPVFFVQQFVISFGSMFTYLVPSVVVLLSGKCDYTVESLTVIVTAIAMLMGSITSIPAKAGNFAALVGYVNRVGQLLDVLEELHEEHKAKEMQNTISYGDGQTLGMTGVELATPKAEDRTVLIPNVDLTITPGKSLVIMGPSGSGKSSLLRVLSGLWPVEKGSIIRPHKVGRDGILFLPQRPYIVLGSLRAQIIYPHEGRECTSSDADLIDLLDRCGLRYLCDRFGLNRTESWEDILSGGEAQRLGFARLFYHRPRFVVMDESTSALDVNTERMCMEAATAMGITMVSIAHRLSVVQYHQSKMQLDGEGGYVIEDLPAVGGTRTHARLSGPATEERIDGGNGVGEP